MIENSSKQKSKKSLESNDQSLDEVWWTDYVEGELDKKTSKDCQKLMSKALHHRRMVKEITNTRWRVQTEGEEIAPKDSAYYMWLHKKIMKNIKSA